MRPAYDCGVDGSTCQHEKKGNHGRHGEEWEYVVSNGLVAVQLTIYSGVGLNGAIHHDPICADLYTHVDFVTDETRIRDGEVGAHPCKLIEVCRGTIGYGLLAMEQFEPLIRLDQIQSEEFWAALEAFFMKELPRVEKTRAEMSKVHRCEHCKGEGLIRDE